MSISEDILNATSIRRCRLAKMVDEKSSKVEPQSSEAEPIVVLEKITGRDVSDETTNLTERTNNKRIAKVKSNVLKEELTDSKNKEKTKYKPGPKSKGHRQGDDPYDFETESITDNKHKNTDSYSDSGDSVKSFGSSELLVDLKKKVKRKKRTWKLGVIKTKTSKKKKELKNAESTIPNDSTQEPATTNENKLPTIKIPNLNCFTDKMYCFNKNINVYSCCLCEYNGNDIVIHYKKQHPHSEIPLSRINPVTAEEAIKQCEDMNLQAVSKLKTKKYVCRFCFKEFTKTNTALETFFWHVVSEHTGEYKQACSECVNVSMCPFNLDIPPPPRNLYGQLIGYICGRCNFTQVSLENLKTHVIIRHDDQQTEVFSINLAEIPRKILQSFLAKLKETPTETPRVLRSTRSNQNLTDLNDDRSDINDSLDSHDNYIGDKNSFSISKRTAKNKIQSKFIFENDDMSDTSSYSKNDVIIKAGIKLEREDDSQDSHCDDVLDNFIEGPSEDVEKAQDPTKTTVSNDVFDYPHFKIRSNDSGIKEYICCIKGVDNHYRTTLLISLKKHVQMKHTENWDGYCFICKVIVTSQGKHMFKDCLQHFLDKHMDNFPIIKNVDESTINNTVKIETSTPVKDAPKPTPYINVRPLFELISPAGSTQTSENSSTLPKIHSVVSLGSEGDADESYKYEEAQAEVMSKKHRVVLETMLWPEKLIQVFKCAGRFCSYTTDNVEEALVHASTHQKIGGESSLACAYCDFNAKGNAIDLVMHVFKKYSHCAYACGKCFYRASASQLVYAHVKRMHADLNADEIAVLNTGTAAQDTTKDDILPRDQAVLHYACKNKDAESGVDCQFKSFILTKFREHLQMKHEKDEQFMCYICDTSVSSPKLLSQHLNSHGLRIYQCCRCLFGAENETELLTHASEKHPLKQPKAYLRIITNKGPNSEVRILPLAVLSKTTVKITEVTACTVKENPVKQAERSIDLENLIGTTISMIESPNTTTEAATVEPATMNTDDTQSENLKTSSANVLLDGDKNPSDITTLLNKQQESNKPVITTLVNNQKEANKPAITPQLSNQIEATNQLTTIIKTELADKVLTGAAQNSKLLSPTKDDVVCLDSDDDNSRQNVIDLSNEQSPEDTSTLKSDSTREVEAKAAEKISVPRACLYKCSKCLNVTKTEAIFKRHLLMCFPETDEVIPCAHCSYSAHWTAIVNHYTSKHLTIFKRYSCSDCDGKFVTKASAKSHMKRIHSVSSPLISDANSTQGLTQCIIDLLGPIERPAPKRKLSVDGASKPVGPSAPKLKKYGPHDVDRLPINPILDDLVYCALCEFSTKVRLNMVRHLQLHAEQQPVPRTAPVNPVPHLDTNEKHFDKMVNLASSSVTSKTDKGNKEGTHTVTEHLTPEAAAVYPKYVTPRHRYTCGAKDCSYISVNESMFKFHWETLHHGTNDYHCVHCPPHQHLDTSRPLTAARIIVHLKMHDTKLYACSSCNFYHHTRKLVEKHVREVHSGKLIIVREDGMPLPSVSAAPVQPVTSAPTMDLKAWQCGLCNFKSMLRPEVIEHCGKFHQSKMQFKCTYCGFRTSNIENISKHQVKQHPTKKEEVFYFYYREGSIPDETDGIARWQKQSQKNESEVKTETQVQSLMQTTKSPPPKLVVNLDIVKKEVVEPEIDVQVTETLEDLRKTFGEFCEPNGLKYKCPLCKVVIEDNQVAMQSHLYEELQYRKWGCAVCSYKAFHKPGLQQHVETEHGHSREAKEPIELQLDPKIEMWVSKLLEHQTAIIDKNKENLAKQKVEILRSNPGPSNVKAAEKALEAPEPPKSVSDPTTQPKPNVSMAELEKLFGPFGVPSNMNYSCPKCNTIAKSEIIMQEHLEIELSKIRWCCNKCNFSFQTYHEAQFHCRSTHQGQSARPVEATRDASLRAAWVAAVLRVQKLSMNYMPVTEAKAPEPTIPTSESPGENSLLVVRYEKNVPTPEEEMRYSRKSDSDDDRLVIDEPELKSRTRILEPVKCPFCDAKFKYLRFLDAHMLKHYGLKPYTCPYCTYSDMKKPMENHIRLHHADKSMLLQPTPLPPMVNAKNEIVCLVCEKLMTKAEGREHFHGNMRPEIGTLGDVVYKCFICLTLHKTIADMKVHHKANHILHRLKYGSYKLQNVNRLIECDSCKVTFPVLAEFRNHCEVQHNLKARLAMTSSNTPITIDCEEVGNKRKANDSITLPTPKRVAKKSTTKLPSVVAVAKKSTTKLPFYHPIDSMEYSYYGTKPSSSNLENVTTLMPFCNTMVPFSLKKLSEIININPCVMVEDINKKTMTESVCE